MLREARTLTISIACPPDDVWAFVADAANLPRWATASFHSVRRDGDHWVLDTPDGEVTLRFVEPNPFGVLDQVVTLPSGLAIHVPMRVVPNGDGSEVIFTVLREPGVGAEAFARDVASVEHDLRSLKAALER